jgi:hypothetical protein
MRLSGALVWIDSEPVAQVERDADVGPVDLVGKADRVLDVVRARRRGVDKRDAQLVLRSRSASSRRIATARSSPATADGACCRLCMNNQRIVLRPSSVSMAFFNAGLYGSALGRY